MATMKHASLPKAGTKLQDAPVRTPQPSDKPAVPRPWKQGEPLGSGPVKTDCTSARCSVDDRNMAEARG